MSEPRGRPASHPLGYSVSFPVTESKPVMAVATERGKGQGKVGTKASEATVHPKPHHGHPGLPRWRRGLHVGGKAGQFGLKGQTRKIKHLCPPGGGQGLP